MNTLTIPGARTNRLNGNAYGNMLGYLSLHRPALWRLRVDLLAVYTVIMLAFVLGPPAIMWLIGVTDPNIAGEVMDINEGTASIGSMGFAFLWIFLILRYERLRLEPGFRNKPSFITLFLCISWFIFWPALIALICFLVDARPNAADWPPAEELVAMLLTYFAGFAIIIGAIALIVKMILLSSVMRMLGSLALAVGVGLCVGAIWVAVFLGPAAIFTPISPHVGNWFYEADESRLLPFLTASGFVLATVWAVSRLIFRGRRLGRSILLALLVTGGAVLCTTLMITAFYGLAVSFPDAGLLQRELSKQGLVVIIVVTWVASYVTPHLVAVGGDLLRGSRSRLTSPVILSCFWSFPICVLSGVTAGLTAAMPYRFEGVPMQQIDPFIGLLAGLLCVASIELLSMLAVRISFLPEP